MLIRQAKIKDAAGIGRVQVDGWRTTYRGIVSDQFLKEMSYKERENRWEERLGAEKGESCTYVAENNRGEVVGFASGGRERSGDFPEFQGELHAIYLLKEVQGNGVGTSLFRHVVQELRRKGFRNMLVLVLAENHLARAFYESFNPQKIGTQSLQIGGQRLEEVAYGWRDLTAVTGF